MSAYVSQPENLFVHPAGWVDLPSGARITRLPLLDRAGWDGRGMARGSDVAAAWAAARGWRLPTPEEYQALHRHALNVHIEPVTIYVDASNAHLMASVEWCHRHDYLVWGRMLAAGWTSQPVANFGKHITDRGYIIGWDKLPGGEVEFIQNLSASHVGHQQLDYATGVHLVDPQPGLPHIPDVAELPVLRRGDVSPAVAGLRALLGVHPGDSFGPVTESAVRAFQADHALGVDGVVGPRTWAKLYAHPFQAAPPPAAVERLGIDVSSHQLPERFDWRKVDEERDFVIARACYGTRPDKHFASHVAGARLASMEVGAYLFFTQAQPWHDQMTTLTNQMALAGFGRGDIVPAVDLEYDTSTKVAVDRAAHNGAGRSLVEALATQFGGCLIYLSPGHWVELGKPAWVLQHHIWTAHWNVKAPAWPSDWVIWQDRVRVIPGYSAGPKGVVDCNRARRLPLIG